MTKMYFLGNFFFGEITPDMINLLLVFTKCLHLDHLDILSSSIFVEIICNFISKVNFKFVYRGTVRTSCMHHAFLMLYQELPTLQLSVTVSRREFTAPILFSYV